MPHPQNQNTIMKKLKLAVTVLASLSASAPISNAATISAQYTFDGNAID